MNGSDLLFTRDKKTNAIIGGGYTLNSSFLNANISPFVQMKGGARSRNRRNRSDKSDRSDRSDKSDKSDKSDRSDRSDRSDSDDDPELKVSTLLERANSNKFIIPAGIFMMHPSSHQEEEKEKEKETVPISTKLKDFIYSADHNTNDDNYDHQEQVVSSDLYEKLLSMISPADKKRYWDPKSTTRKRGNRNQEIKPSSGLSPSIKTKTRRKV
jgi:hypothetical protein